MKHLTIAILILILTSTFTFACDDDNQPLSDPDLHWEEREE